MASTVLRVTDGGGSKIDKNQWAAVSYESLAQLWTCDTVTLKRRADAVMVSGRAGLRAGRPKSGATRGGGTSGDTGGLNVNTIPPQHSALLTTFLTLDCRPLA